MPRLLGNSEIGADFLRDESRMEGRAEFACFPSSSAEAASALSFASGKNLKVTISGGRTGIAGGAVPDGGLLISLTRMQKIGQVTEQPDGTATVICESGVLLSELQNILLQRKCKYFFPPDPTETSATVGGMIACNASGAHTFKYGPTRKYVKSITAILSNGEIVKLSRGQKANPDGSFTVRLSDGSTCESRIPNFPQPATKNAAGYYSGTDMDLIDLLIGSEGTLALISEAELVLVTRPEFEFNAMFFLPNESSSLSLTRKLREDRGIEVTAIEYFDPAAVEMLRQRRLSMGQASAVPPCLPEDKACAGIYIDVTCTKEGAASAALKLKEIAGDLGAASPLAIWAGFDKDERERLRKFRHALPETVNTLISERRKTYPGMTKLGTDMAVPDEFLEEIMNFYRKELDAQNLEYVIFGHIGNNHLHVNILPRNPDEYLLGKKLYMKFAETVIRMKGSVSAEHGVGKLKKNFLAMMLGEDGLEQMRAVKRAFDPDFRLGTGTLF
ncbi:MAG: hypothetical protein A2X49_02960 [Lentisphaerae bacterium GWF2_52_8]|nr:MAG: hypothetical protein A2X49_02960 [Lentisphaerae bacterium GWF2_52_8]